MIFIWAILVGIFYVVIRYLPYHVYDKNDELVVPMSKADLVNYNAEQLREIQQRWQKSAENKGESVVLTCQEEIEKIEKFLRENAKKI